MLEACTRGRKRAAFFFFFSPVPLSGAARDHTKHTQHTEHMLHTTQTQNIKRRTNATQTAQTRHNTHTQKCVLRLACGWMISCLSQGPTDERPDDCFSLREELANKGARMSRLERELQETRCREAVAERERLVYLKMIADLVASQDGRDHFGACAPLTVSFVCGMNPGR